MTGALWAEKTSKNSKNVANPKIPYQNDFLDVFSAYSAPIIF